jgi:hypothetical protein
MSMMTPGQARRLREKRLNVRRKFETEHPNTPLPIELRAAVPERSIPFPCQTANELKHSTANRAAHAFAVFSSAEAESQKKHGRAAQMAVAGVPWRSTHRDAASKSAAPAASSAAEAGAAEAAAAEDDDQCYWYRVAAAAAAAEAASSSAAPAAASSAASSSAAPASTATTDLQHWMAGFATGLATSSAALASSTASAPSAESADDDDINYAKIMHDLKKLDSDDEQ